ncbi:Hypothetical protein AA314_09932 [Archangium gephyra]|uniref:Uncharacterized protein n=1 Tax=Archangium gephyra TaxID=48 RepID=A0AAC8QIR0_9BACT|nr:Hypothetical protein AA314_09932 [Archangium gephyra]
MSVPVIVGVGPHPPPGLGRGGGTIHGVQGPVAVPVRCRSHGARLVTAELHTPNRQRERQPYPSRHGPPPRVRVPWEAH